MVNLGVNIMPGNSTTAKETIAKSVAIALAAVGGGVGAGEKQKESNGGDLSYGQAFVIGALFAGAAAFALLKGGEMAYRWYQESQPASLPTTNPANTPAVTTVNRTPALASIAESADEEPAYNLSRANTTSIAVQEARFSIV
jgi:hypothetical protein